MLVISSDAGVLVDSVRNDVEGVSTASEVATRVSGRTMLLALEPFRSAGHNGWRSATASARQTGASPTTPRATSRPPIAPVVNNKPRPIVMRWFGLHPHRRCRFRMDAARCARVRAAALEDTTRRLTRHQPRHRQATHSAPRAGEVTDPEGTVGIAPPTPVLLAEWRATMGGRATSG